MHIYMHTYIYIIYIYMFLDLLYSLAAEIKETKDLIVS